MANNVKGFAEVLLKGEEFTLSPAARRKYNITGTDSQMVLFTSMSSEGTMYIFKDNRVQYHTRQAELRRCTLHTALNFHFSVFHPCLSEELFQILISQNKNVFFLMLLTEIFQCHTTNFPRLQCCLPINGMPQSIS